MGLDFSFSQNIMQFAPADFLKTMAAKRNCVLSYVCSQLSVGLSFSSIAKICWFLARNGENPVLCVAINSTTST